MNFNGFDFNNLTQNQLTAVRVAAAFDSCNYGYDDHAIWEFFTQLKFYLELKEQNEVEVANVMYHEFKAQKIAYYV